MDSLAEVYEGEWSRVVGALIRSTRDLDLAEDAAQDAFLAASSVWPRDGVPDNPVAWLITTGRRKAIDRQRRESTLARKLPLLIVPNDRDDDSHVGDSLPDDRLRLIFTCCHPTIAMESRVALAHRLICGLGTVTIARLFLVPVPTMAARITRAKKKIAAAGIAYRVPGEVELPERLSAVLSVIYLVFTAGHTALAGDRLVNPQLTRRALDLGTMMAQLMPDEPEVLGLYAMMMLSDARRAARVDGYGRMVLLEDQDRSLWDVDAIRDGLATVEVALTRDRLPGPFAPQAAIEAAHMESPSYAETDWPQLLALYDVLRRIAPSPLVDLNRAVVISRLAGPGAGLEVLDELATWEGGSVYYLYTAARADLLRRLNRFPEAAGEYRRARDLTDNAVEREFLEGRIAEIEVANASDTSMS